VRPIDASFAAICSSAMIVGTTPSFRAVCSIIPGGWVEPVFRRGLTAAHDWTPY
jgi:hypothetical protein